MRDAEIICQEMNNKVPDFLGNFFFFFTIYCQGRALIACPSNLGSVVKSQDPVPHEVIENVLNGGMITKRGVVLFSEIGRNNCRYHNITHGFLCPPFGSRSPRIRFDLRAPESVMLVAPMPPPRVLTLLTSCVCSCLCRLNERTTS